MPEWLQMIARCLPITHAIRAMQLAVFRGSRLSDLRTEVTILGLFSLILLPLSIRVFSRALNQARRSGTLHQQ
jgi:ABC-2 type transport system permease protein